MTRQTMTVAIRGVTYPSAQAAATALGVKPSTLSCAISRGDIDRIGLGVDYARRETKGGLPPEPVIVAGRRFASMADLARFLGRDPRNVRVSLRAGGTAQGRIVVAVMKQIAAKENAARRAADLAE